MNKKIRLVFFSSAPIGIPFMEALLHDERFIISWIVTQPDQPSGRGMKMHANSIKEKALEYGITNISTPQTLRINSKKYPWEWEQCRQWLHEIQPDYNLVIAYGKLIPQDILDIPLIASINIHGSLLPAYRWASPIQTCLLNGDTESGITVMKMSSWLDEWDSIKQLRIPLEITTTTKDLIGIFGTQWPMFVNQVLQDFSEGKGKATPQNHTLATSTYKIIKEDGMIDIHTMPIEQILRKYNAYYLRPKIYYIYQDKRVLIEDITINKNLWNTYKFLPLVGSDFLLNPAVYSIKVKPEGKKTMDRSSWRLWYLWR